MEEKRNEAMERQEVSKKTNSLFVVSIVSLIVSIFVLAVVFAPIAIVSGAYILGSGDKRGWWGGTWWWNSFITLVYKLHN
ncbi:MAG: hypothetical protein ABIM32_06360 [candidate division WOR-3 bacterium]